MPVENSPDFIYEELQVSILKLKIRIINEKHDFANVADNRHGELLCKNYNTTTYATKSEIKNLKVFHQVCTDNL